MMPEDAPNGAGYCQAQGLAPGGGLVRLEQGLRLRDEERETDQAGGLSVARVAGGARRGAQAMMPRMGCPSTSASR